MQYFVGFIRVEINELVEELAIAHKHHLSFGTKLISKIAQLASSFKFPCEMLTVHNHFPIS